MRFKLGILAVIIFFAVCAYKKDNPLHTQDETQNQPPVAGFTIHPDTVAVDSLIYVNATQCTDDKDAMADLLVRWDWEDDGTWDISTRPIALLTDSLTTR